MKSERVNIKGTINGLVIVIDDEDDFPQLKGDLEAKIVARPGFFKKASFKIHAPNLSSEVIQALEELCCSYEMELSPDINWPHAEKTAPLKQIEAAQAEMAASSAYISAPATSTTGAAVLDDSTPGTLLINRNLRSGQKLHYYGNLVILGDVNPGAEVTAAGDIIVMGSLRGIAHAGAMGNDKAVILACRLQPTQLRIADKITRPPEQDYGLNRPELARLSEGQMVIEPYNSQKTKWDNF